MPTTSYFELLTQPSSPASPRVGLLHTAHGDVETPAFLPVATQGTVKAVSPGDLCALGVSFLIANSYHLMMRPGTDLIEALGGLHRFMDWDRPIATDSGGFQIFSLGHLKKLTDNDVTFQSHIDGALHTLTPESAVRNQERLGVDVMMALDQCLGYTEDLDDVRKAVDRTTLWAGRCREAWTGLGLLYGIVQGGVFPEERARSAEAITALDFPGYAVGGLSVGEPKAKMLLTLDAVCPLLPVDRPRHLLGVGSPEDLLEGIARGIDQFDCVLPTRAARNGSLYTAQGRVNILNARYRTEAGPLEEGCDCPTCARFSAAYLHHLFKSKEILGLRLATLHNVRFMARLLEQARRAIREERFAQFKEAFLAGYEVTDEETRMAQRARWLEARGPDPASTAE